MSSTSHTHRRTQPWDARAYAANGRFVADMAGDVFAMLDAKPGEYILDLGCGDGALTEKLAKTGAMVTGCDANDSMLAAAAARGLNVIKADVRVLPFCDQFDAVFSNAALHWVREQASVLQGVQAALKPGGRFVAEMGGLGNIAAIRTALSATLAPYGIHAEDEATSFFPSAETYNNLLVSAGFYVEQINLVPRPTPLNTGMRQWLLTFRSGILQTLSLGDRERVLAETVSFLEPVLRDDEGNWWADYVRLRFRAVRA